jgi:hypothetical protein
VIVATTRGCSGSVTRVGITRPRSQEVISTPTTPDHSFVDLQEVRNRHRHVHHLITRRTNLHDAFQRSEDGRAILAALDFIPALCAEAERLSRLLAALRLDHANLTAAARATLAAHRDGEADPLYYLRDELSAQATTPDNAADPAVARPTSSTSALRRRYRHPYGGEAR